MAEKAPWEMDEMEVAPWETEAPSSMFDVSLEGLGRGALEALPVAGSLAGGFFGTSLGPAGTIGGAALGATGGKALEQAGKEFFFGEGPETRGEQFKQLGMEAVAGGMGEIGGQAVGKLAGKAIEKAPGALAKIGSALTGISEQEIKTYASKADKIKALARSTDASTIEAADQIRTQFNKDIGTTIGGINQELSAVLSDSSKTVQSQPIVDALEKYKAKLDPILWKEQVGQIDDIVSRVQGAAQGGEIPIGKANEIKQYLQEKASSAYRNGDMFQIGKEAANAAKSGAAVARQVIDQAEPQVTKLNANLQRFHQIEDEMNQNLLKVGAPESALMAAGTGGNVRNVKALEELGQMTGTPMLEQAQELAAMRTFTNPPLLPVDTTGKTATRMGAAAAVGALGGGPIGGAIGGALSSPLVLKSIIETGRAVGPAVQKAIPQKPTREMLYKGLMQKYFEAPSDKEKELETRPPNQSSIMNKVKGTNYAALLETALKNGGEKSFAAANYVLMNRDQKYRDLINQQEG